MKEISQVEFSTAVIVKTLNIYEIHSGGRLKKVSARAADGSWKSIWETVNLECLKDPRIFSPPIQVCEIVLFKLLISELVK